jgi:prophage regulatory protein
MWRQEYSDMANAILRLPAVKARVGLSRSTLYLKISRGEFPPPIDLGERAVGWLEFEVDEWISQQIQNSRKPVA